MRAESLRKFGFRPGSLDAIDVQLLGALQADGKLQLSQLGEQVGLSPPSVLERVRKLEVAGVIKGYYALVDARRVGLDVTAFIGVGVASPARIEQFEGWVAGEPEILECHHVTGAHTLLLKVKCRDTLALERLIRRIQCVEGVVRTETTVVLSTHMERTQVALERAPEEDGEGRPRRARRTSKGP